MGRNFPAEGNEIVVIRWRPQGMALIVSLMLGVFLFLMGFFFLYLFQRDFFFQGQHQASEQAYYMALSGVDYYRNQPIDFSSGGIDTPPFTLASPATVQVNPRARFVVYGLDVSDPGTIVDVGTDPMGNPLTWVVGSTAGTSIISTGQIVGANGNVIAQRTVYVPLGLMTRMYEQ